MEGRGILVHVQMHETQIVENLPFKGGQVCSSFQTTDRLERVCVWGVLCVCVCVWDVCVCVCGGVG